VPLVLSEPLSLTAGLPSAGVALKL
jgi:hypothetical protein